MFVKIAIRNYQSIVNASLELGRITVITGHSDSGKSAFIRAIKRACSNESGAEFLTVDTKGEVAEKAQVAIQTDKAIVVWERTKTTVAYRVVKDGKEYKFTKMGRGFVPDEVSGVLGIRAILIDPSVPSATHWIQFAGQFDLPFLVADRGGVATSRLLGRLTGLHVFSQVAKKLVSAKSSLKTSQQVAQAEIDKKRTELIPYENLETRLDRTLQLQRHLGETKKKQAKMIGLQRIRDNYKRIKAVIESTDEKKLIHKLSYLDGLRQKFQKLWRLLNNLHSLKKLTKAKYESVTLIDAPPSIKVDIAKDIKRLEALLALKVRHKIHRANVHELGNQVQAAILELRVIEDELEELDKTYPLCPFQDQFHSQQGTYRCQALTLVQVKRDKATDGG